MSNISLKDLDLEPRERLALICGVVALLLAVFLLIYIPIGPRAAYVRSAERLEGLQYELQDAQLTKLETQDELDNQKRLIALLDSRPPDFDLYAFIESTCRDMNLRADNRATLQNYRTRNSSANQPMVQLDLDGVSLEELIDLLYTIYDSRNLIAVYKMDELAPAANGQGLNCSMTLVTLKV